MDIEIKKLQVLKDHRGWLSEVFRNEFGIENIAQVTLIVANPGMTRGNHYHLRKTEWFCVVKGRAMLALKDIDSKETLEITLKDDELRIVRIPPRVVHAFKNDGEEDVYVLHCADESFNPQDPDTFPETITT